MKRGYHQPPYDSEFGSDSSVSWRGILGAACLFLAVGGIAYILWYSDIVPKQVARTGSIAVSLPGSQQKVIEVRTRSVYLPQRLHRPQAMSRNFDPTAPRGTMEQVQLPNQQWIDCRGNRAAAFLRHHAVVHEQG